MARNTNRRQFIGQSAALGAACWVGGQTQLKASRSALQSLSAACVGVGGKGSSDSSHINKNGVSIVGICDVDAGTPINVPCNYYPQDDPSVMPTNRWRSHAHLLYGNWINEIYQSTPFEMDQIGR